MRPNTKLGETTIHLEGDTLCVWNGHTLVAHKKLSLVQLRELASACTRAADKLFYDTLVSPTEHNTLDF